jgi:hypothetical protein
MENEQWRTDDSGEQTVLGLIVIDGGKNEAIGRRPLLL